VDNKGIFQIFVSTRASTESSWGAPVPVYSSPTGYNLFAPSPTGDGLSLFLVTSTSTDLLDVQVATRDTVDAGFSAPAPVPNISQPQEGLDVFVIPDQSALYQCSTATGPELLYVSSPEVEGGFGLPAEITPLDMDDAGAPTEVDTSAVSPDQLTIFFGSTRAGGLGNEDVWMSKRATVQDVWQAPLDVKAVNSPGSEMPTWISADGCRLYMQVNPTGDWDGWQISLATRPR
jgi:hypothetical protein